MLIDCISNLHGYTPALLGGDILIIVGDLTARDTFEGYQKFMLWLTQLPYRCCKVVILVEKMVFLCQGVLWQCYRKLVLWPDWQRLVSYPVYE